MSVLADAPLSVAGVVVVVVVAVGLWARSRC